LDFRILGPVEVAGGGRLVRVTAPLQGALLASLLLDANQVVSTERLIYLLWGAAPSNSAKVTLQTYVYRLRQTLAEAASQPTAVLHTRASGYLLEVPPGALDLQVFRQLAAHGRQALAEGALPRAAERLAQALALWRGPALADISVESLRAQAWRLEEERLLILEERIQADLGLGRHAALVGELGALTAEQPLRERLHGLLMLALYRSGRQADALDVYRRARARLVEELGIEPDVELQRLQRLILAGDPSLDAPPAPARIVVAGLAGASDQAGSVPRQLPADIATFTGRDQELAHLRDTLTAETSGPVVISAIDGIGGVGKSALAIHCAHQLSGRFPDGQLYVNLQGATAGLAPLTPLDALGRLLRSLGVDPTQIPAQVEEAAGLFRSLAAQRHLLVVLDNAATVEQVRPLLIPGPSCRLLVTSRQVLATLEGARVLHLDLLPRQQAVELLGRITEDARVAAEPQATAEVVRLCGYLPLAIQIAGARLAARPNWPVQELARRLADAARRLEELATGDLAVRASFDVSLHSLQHSPDTVDQAAAAAFGLLGLPDGPDLSVAAAARLLDQLEPRTEILLERLVDAQLLQSLVPGRYQFHDLVRLHARHHAASTRAEAVQLAALTRLIGYYTATVWCALGLLRPGDQRRTAADQRWTSGGLRFLDAETALGWLEAERANLLAAIDQIAAIAPAIPAKLATELTRALFGFLEVHGHWADGVQANQTALELARRTRDRAGQAHTHDDLGFIYERLGRYSEALEHHQQARILYEELGDRHGQAVSLNGLGTVCWRLGRYPEALDYYRQALPLFLEVRDRYGQAVSLGNLALVQRRLGRYQEAVHCHEQSLAIKQQLGDRRGQAISLSNLGVVLERLGRYPEALDQYQQAMPLFGELGDRRGQANCLDNLGVVLERLGRHAEALDHYRQALALFRELGDRRGQAEVLRDLGDTLSAAGDRRQAREAWREALELSEALRIPEAAEVHERLAALPAEPDGAAPG
jgi:DNA-binding SARP family transcriptional activator/tetratricopeptide (TPR) repeat protein